MCKDLMEIKLSHYFVINHPKVFPKHHQACYLPRTAGREDEDAAQVCLGLWQGDRGALQRPMERGLAGRGLPWRLKGALPPKQLCDLGIHLLTPKTSDFYNKHCITLNIKYIPCIILLRTHPQLPISMGWKSTFPTLAKPPCDPPRPHLFLGLLFLPRAGVSLPQCLCSASALPGMSLWDVGSHAAITVQVPTVTATERPSFLPRHASLTPGSQPSPPLYFPRQVLGLHLGLARSSPV